MSDNILEVTRVSNCRMCGGLGRVRLFSPLRDNTIQYLEPTRGGNKQCVKRLVRGRWYFFNQSGTPVDVKNPRWIRGMGDVPNQMSRAIAVCPECEDRDRELVV